MPTVRQFPVAPLPPPAEVGRPAPGLRPLEIAWGLPLGVDDDVASGDEQRFAFSVAASLDNAIRPALQRSPCLVSFSGGRDSSALLAWATHLARREGLELPIPITLVIPGDSDADEDTWQRQVLTHLGLSDRVVIPVGEELDCVGPVAAEVLSRHGLLWPFNTHMHAPIFAAATGGAVITGFGGDELGRSSQYALAAQVLSRRRGASAADALIVGLALAPRPVRYAVHHRRNRRLLADLSWLTARSRTALVRQLSRQDSVVPVRWDKTITDWWPRQRYFRVTERSFEVVAAAWDVKVHHPFADAGLHAALARRGTSGGLGSRAQLMDVMFGEHLPQSIRHRESKAAFSNVLFTATAQKFARSWSGRGLDESLVDTVRLRELWSGSQPVDMRTMALLQLAWLNDNRK